jgi:vacuolar-type H+-ATPase subunit H
MAGTFSKTDLSPLDQIRLTEAEITRKTVVAREDAERRLAEARRQAAKIKKRAREEGTRAGKVQFKEIVSTSEEEARAITAQAQNQANTLQQKGRTRMEMAVDYAVNIVLGLEMERMNNES